jgi:hypothetical protein
MPGLQSVSKISGISSAIFPIWRPEVMLSDAKKVSISGCVEQGGVSPVFFKISLKLQNCIAVLVCAYA